MSTALETPNGLGFALAVIMYVSLPTLVADEILFAHPDTRRTKDETTKS
jgi:hypothetical protein